MAFFEDGALRLHFDIRGRGPRLLFHPGTASDLRVFPNIFDSPLAKRFKILCCDPRGIGQSNSPDASPTMTDYADDMLRLMQHVGWSDALVVGESFGGMVAQEFALRHSQCVRKLVLIVSSAGGAGGSSFPYHQYDVANMSIRERAAFWVEAGDTRTQSSEQRAMNQDDYKRAFTFYQQVFEHAAANAESTAFSARQMHARKGHDTFSRLVDLNIETLVCGGRYDRTAPIANQIALFEQLPNARLGFFQGGHNVMWQDAMMWDCIETFLTHQSEESEC
ncbi:putative protein [BD1-7 clade bacterium]|uniref:AB hydrolase-1 domain-containing protein n=1 Tax=BD1-7 clade bacterium TaxID=2029982 RepID=A0A5S9PMT5_9GAMM|nr:putative protein [BD1-7 clade bacterium]